MFASCDKKEAGAAKNNGNAEQNEDSVDTATDESITITVQSGVNVNDDSNSNETDDSSSNSTDADNTDTDNDSEDTIPVDSDNGITFNEANKSIWALVDCNVRSTPDSSSTTNKIGYLMKDQEATCVGISTEWIKIKYNNSIGYVTIGAITEQMPENAASSSTQSGDSPIQYKKSNLAITDTFTTVNETVYVTSQVNVRNGPGTYYDSLGKLEAGVSLTRVGVNAGWSKISYQGNYVYINNSYLSKTKPK